MNAFDDPEADFLALINLEGQFSLWPAFLDVPPGWSVALGPATRELCLAHVERHWTDQRPLSLQRATVGDHD